MKAYSYLRFSTPAQQEGDSYRRQSTAAREWCLRQDPPVELDESLRFEDLGLSAYRGANAETGKLGVFKRAVEDGIVPVPCYLVVESLDRLSRQQVQDAVYMMQGIIRLGVSIITTSDGKEYSRNTQETDSMMTMLMMALTFIRANEESATKGKRVAAAWENKRAKVRSDPTTHYTKMLPFWLSTVLADGKPVGVVANEQVVVVQEIYNNAASGMGSYKITRQLNEKWLQGDQRYKPPRADIWFQSTVNKTLAAKTVEGHLVTKGGVLENIYPAVIDPVVLATVRAVKTTTVRVKNDVVHPLAGLMFCTCGSPAARLNKSDYVYMVCAKAKSGTGCFFKTWPYKNLLSCFDQINPSLFVSDEFTYIDTGIDFLQEQVEETYLLLKQNKRSAVALKAWQEAEAALAEERKKLDALVLANSGPSKTATQAAVNDFMNGVRDNRIFRTLFKKGVIDFQSRSITMTTHTGKDVVIGVADKTGTDIAYIY